MSSHTYHNNHHPHQRSGGGKNDGKGPVPFELTASDISSGGLCVSKTFDALPSFVGAEEMLKYHYGDLEDDSFQSYGIEDISKVTIKPIVIDLEEIIKTYYMNAGSMSLYINYLRNTQMMEKTASKNPVRFTAESRTQPGVTVCGILNTNQRNAIELNDGELYTTSEIFKTVPTVFTGYKDLCDTLFGSNFHVVLTKTKFKTGDQTQKEKGKKKPSEKNGASDVSNLQPSGKIETASNNNNNNDNDNDDGEGDISKHIGSKFKTLLDIPDQIIIDEISQQVMAQFWVPFFRATEEERLKTGIVAFYFRQEVISVPVYVIKDEEDEEEEEMVEGSEEEIESNVFDENFPLSQFEPLTNGIQTNYGEMNIVEWLKQKAEDTVLGMGFALSKMLGSSEIGSRFAGRLNDNYRYKGYMGTHSYENMLNKATTSLKMSESEIKDYFSSNATASDIRVENKYKFSKVLQNSLDSDTLSKMDDMLVQMESQRMQFVSKMESLLSRASKRSDIYGNTKTDDMIENVALEKEIRQFEKEVEEYMDRWYETLNAFQNKHGVEVPQSVGKVVVPEVLKNIMTKYSYDDNLPGIIELYQSGVEEGGEENHEKKVKTPVDDSKKSKKKKRNPEKKSAGFGQITPDGTAIVDGSEKIVVKKYINATHHVPTLAPLNEGSIYTYFDGKCQRYMWIWNTDINGNRDGVKDRFSSNRGNFNPNNMEPFMHFFVSEHCNHHGSLKSPLSRMIPLYNEYVTLANKVDKETKTGKTDVYTIEKDVPKIDKNDPQYMSGMNYNPMFADSGHPPNTRSTAVEEPPHFTNTGFDSLYINNDPGTYNGTTLMSGPDPKFSKTRSDDYIARSNMKRQFEYHMFSDPYQCIDSSSGLTYHESVMSQNYGEKILAKERKVFANVNKKKMITCQLATMALGRPVVNTPLGFFIDLKPGEKVKKISESTDTDVVRLKELKVWLDELGGIMSGYPMMSLMNREGKSINKQSDAGYSTKNETRSTSSTGVGYFVHQENRNPTQELRATNRDTLVMVYSSLAVEIFKMAYSNFFSVGESWYKRLVSNTFDSEGVKNGNLPDVASLFDITVTFPPANNSNMNEVLSLYNMGALDKRNVALCLMSLVKKCTGSTPKNFLNIYSKSLDRDFETFEERIGARLDEMRQMEIEKQKPEKNEHVESTKAINKKKKPKRQEAKEGASKKTPQKRKREEKEDKDKEKPDKNNKKKPRKEDNK